MTSILKRVEDFSKGEIKDLIAENYRVLDKNLELIGGSLGTRREMLWDLIGIDKEKKVVLIDVELRYTDKILYQILNRLDWAWEHIENITKMHSSYEINADQMPRVIIIAPSYSSFFKKSISYLNYRIRINLFTYTYLENNAGKSLFLEPVETRVQYERVLRSDSKNLKPIEVPNNTKITTEEIMEFLH
ncbi:MAG: hypothetical protein AMJ42_02740 [Deltaproteobacteria bacterium DG_8]|nr:MAG: hypothetical protein AMJ42_02740 [Deltaproteobacteria bacterium DG_8]